jgi:hypothetical protein
MKLGLGLNIKTTVGEWTPNNLSDLLHWYKYDTGISTFFVAGASNYIVTEWQDQKGSNHLVDTATPANTSAYNIAHPKQDQTTKEVVFDHGGDQLDFTSHLSLGEFAIYFRIQFDDTTFGDFIMEDEAGNNFLKVQSSTELRVKISGSRHDFTYGAELEEDTPYVIGYERTDTPATTDDRITITINGSVLTQSGTGDGTEAITNTLDLEKIGDPANTIRIKEIVICNKALSASDRTKLTNYLTSL